MLRRATFDRSSSRQKAMRNAKYGLLSNLPPSKNFRAVVAAGAPRAAAY